MTKILHPKFLADRSRKKPILYTKNNRTGKKLKSKYIQKLSGIVNSSLYVSLEKINIYEYDGQYALYGSTISRLTESHENLKLPIRINSRFVIKCPDCPYKTISRSSYNYHQQRKHTTFDKKELFFCYKCSYSTSEKSKLSIHMVSHQILRHIKCPHCGKMFKAKHSLNGHINRMHNESVKYHYCDTCSFQCKSSQSLVSHKERTHIPDSDRKEEFLCTLCPFTTKKKWSLQFHTGYRHKKRFSCSKCSFITPLADSFEKHRCKLYQCSECDYKTHRITIYKNHCTTHRKREELPLLTCPFCPFVTTSPGSIASHRTDHKHNKEVKCPECQITMKKRSLATHMKTKHLTKNVGRHACLSCNYTTMNSFNLQRHIENRHTEKSKLETLRCDRCDFQTKSKGSLYMHVKHAHCNVTYSCKQCQFVTVHRSNFTTHMKIHTKREAVICEKCSKPFTSKCNLKMHMKRIHDEGQTYVCKLCPEDFQKVCKTIADLRSHMFRHKTKSELETFKCHNCSYEAKKKCDLAKHIQLIHINNKDKYHICSQCYYRAKHKESLKQHIKEMHKKKVKETSKNAKKIENKVI